MQPRSQPASSVLRPGGGSLQALLAPLLVFTHLLGRFRDQWSCFLVNEKPFFSLIWWKLSEYQFSTVLKGEDEGKEGSNVGE